MSRQFIYPEHQRRRPDKRSDGFMADGEQRQQFKTICIQQWAPPAAPPGPPGPTRPHSGSVSSLILEHNPFGAPTSHHNPPITAGWMHAGAREEQEERRRNKEELVHLL